MSADEHLGPQWRTLFHGTGYDRPEDIEARGFTPSGQGESGPGVYLTSDRKHAERYARDKINGVLYEVQADVRNPLVRRPHAEGDPGEAEYRRIQQNTTGWYTRPGAALEALKAHGYDAVDTHFEGLHEIAVHDPARIRIRKRTQITPPLD